MFSLRFAVVFSLLLSPQEPASAAIAMALRSMGGEVAGLFWSCFVVPAGTDQFGMNCRSALDAGNVM
jgi:hypothetical protein